MSGRPACQRASIKLSVDGAEDIVIPSTLVNFSPVTIDAFQKHIMALCRLTLKDPLYECESIFISDREVDLAYLKSILSGILKEVVAGKKPSVPKLIVIGKPASGLGRNKSGLPRRAPIPSFRTPSSFPKTPNTLLRAASANNLDDSVDEDDIDEYADGISRDFSFNMSIDAETPSKRKAGDLKPSPGMVDMYAGGKTAAEVFAKFNDNLRSSVRSNRSLSVPRKDRVSKKTNGQSGGSSGGIGGGGGESGFFGGDDKDRPSMAIICQQWEFMRSNFVNNSEEELEWLMISKRPGAYRHSHKKNEAAEDRYFKALSDIETFEFQHERMTAMSNVICPLLAAMADQSAVLSVDPANSDALSGVADAQAGIALYLRNYADRDPWEAGKWEIKGTIKKLLQSIASNTQRGAAGRVASNMVVKETIPKEVKDARIVLAVAMNSSEESLKAMEKWSKREKETDDYHQVIAEEEAAWLLKELPGNTAALSLMRSYMPCNIADMTVKDLRECVAQKGGLITLELATELKANRLLQWVVMHPLDIANENFLNGEKKQFFLNLERLDVVELRAIVSVLPLKFELDGDGRKAEWRERLMTRAKQVISQQNGDCVKGSWNPSKASRSLVKLKELKSDLLRRPIYFYPTTAQCQVKLKQYESRENLLAKKEASLIVISEEAIHCKTEYDTLLREMRDPEVRAFFGADQVAMAKDTAKGEWTRAESHRKALTEEIVRLRKTIEESPTTREQFLESMESINQHLASRGLQWREVKAADSEDTVDDEASLFIIPTATPLHKPCSFVIEGMFDQNISIERSVRHAAKFVTAEEEAESRKQELDALKKRHETVPEMAVIENTVENASDEADSREFEYDDELSSEITITMSIGSVCVGAGADAFADSDSSGLSEGAGLETPIMSPPLSVMTESGRTTNQNTGHPTPCTPGLSSPRHVLSSVDPDLICRLNKMFTPQKRFTPGSSCAVSLSSSPTRLRGAPFLMDLVDRNGTTADVNGDDRGTVAVIQSCEANVVTGITSIETVELIPCSPVITTAPIPPIPPPPPVPTFVPDPVPIVFKGSQSKFLQKLQAKKEEEKEAHNSQKASLSEHSLPVDAFLGRDGDGQSGLAFAPPAIKMSFLDQIKAKKPAATTMSFLDQIKARNQQQ